jgi:isocitrate dehydrogenase
MMLTHVGKANIANKIKNALLTTIEQGYHTADIYKEGQSIQKVSTQEFADKIIENLGQRPEQLPVSNIDENASSISIPEYNRPKEKQVLVGTDVFINWQGNNPEEIGNDLAALESYRLKLKMITNRGVKVYPNGLPETYCTDHWRCRFVAQDAVTSGSEIKYEPIMFEQILALLSNINNLGYEVIKTENLYEFDGKRGFSLGQGE